MHKLRTETRNRSSYNPKSHEPSASRPRGVQSGVDQGGERFAQPRTSQHVAVFIPTAVLQCVGPLAGDRTGHSSRCGIAGCLSDRPQLAVAKFTAHKYRSFPLLLRPTHEGS